MRGKYITTQIWITCLSSQQSKINAAEKAKTMEPIKENDQDSNKERVLAKREELGMVA